MKNDNVPRHVAIIMDGNGRWAQERGLLRYLGHQKGAERIQDVIEEAIDQGVGYLTLYTFSKENWVRPKEEVDFLMGLLSRYLDQELPRMKANQIRFNIIGSLADLPAEVQKKVQRNMQETRDFKKLVLTLALSYSGRAEIVEACRKIAEKVRAGELAASAIDEATIRQYLYTHDLPDPDLLIRTSGELRVSNFLLWQISYAEIYVTEKLWPDFTSEEFHKAIEAYQKRERRFGFTEAPRPHAR